MVWLILSFFNLFVLSILFFSGVFFIGALSTYGAYAALRDLGLYEKVHEWIPSCF